MQIRISNVELRQVHHHLLPSTCYHPAIQTQMIAKLFNRRTFLLNFTLHGVKINISLQSEQHYFTMPVVDQQALPVVRWELFVLQYVWYVKLCVLICQSGMKHHKFPVGHDNKRQKAVALLHRGVHYELTLVLVAQNLSNSWYLYVQQSWTVLVTFSRKSRTYWV